MTAFPYTAGQLAGFDTFCQFYADPMENVLILKGHSGTGKSTLIKKMIDHLPKMNQMLGLIDLSFKPYEVALTATTNQAAEALSAATGVSSTRTIHSLLGLMPQKDHRTGKTKLIIRSGAPKAQHMLIFIDEASYIDQELMGKIFEQLDDCKIVFCGDHRQCLPITSNFMPAFSMSKNQIELTEDVRVVNPNSPLRPLIKGLREAVDNNIFPVFDLHPGVIDHVDQHTFEQAAMYAFTMPDAPSCKILAYRNDKVIYYNNLLTQHTVGTSVPQANARMIVNEQADNRVAALKTGEEVVIEAISPTKEYGVDGYRIELRGKPGGWFLPASRQSKKAREKMARREEEWDVLSNIDRWVDLRPAFACTINKSQGSTYNTIFLDLGDVAQTVRTGNVLARMLYVGISRASHRVILTGDVV